MTQQPIQLTDLIGRKLKAHFQKSVVVAKLLHVDLNLGMLTLQTKKSLIFIAVDRVHLEVPLKE